MRRLLTAESLQAGPLVITGEEAHHARNVLRLRVGDQVYVHDGAGYRAAATITDLGRHALSLALEQPESVPDSAASGIHVVTAAPKGSRFEDLVRGLTELGVGQISPLRCQRSVRDPNLERAERVAAEALKQCGRGRLPKIGPVVDFSSCQNLPQPRILLDPAGGLARPGAPGKVTLMIGPEGGFTAEERAQLLDQGAVAVRVAGPILRIETAALAAAAIWASAWEHNEH